MKRILTSRFNQKRTIDALGQAIKERENTVLERERTIHALENMIKERENTVLKRERTIHALENTIKEHEKTKSNSPVYLGNNRILAKTQWDGYVVVPSWNVDVAIGAVRDGIHEAWTTRLVQELLRPGDTYLNAGANYGYYTALGGRLVGHEGLVIAVEPNPHIFPYLFDTTYWNGTSHNTKFVYAALSDISGQSLMLHFNPQFLGGGGICLSTVENGPVGCFFSSREEADWFSKQSFGGTSTFYNPSDASTMPMIQFNCQSKCIDDIIPADIEPSLIHLDIEGYEPFAILGASSTLGKSKNLKLITEWASYDYKIRDQSYKTACTKAIDLLFSLGYTVRHIKPRFASDGGLLLSEPLTKAFLQEEAEHGDYVWVKKDQDPWG